MATFSMLFLKNVEKSLIDSKVKIRMSGGRVRFHASFHRSTLAGFIIRRPPFLLLQNDIYKLFCFLFFDHLLSR
uniref:Plasmid pARN4 n=1 Tax=Saccharolobus islandicus TaxID=43080 RepID=R7RB35_SACIS|nr:unnamed protein product [Sulfolobus islandicus]